MYSLTGGCLRAVCVAGADTRGQVCAASDCTHAREREGGALRGHIHWLGERLAGSPDRLCYCMSPGGTGGIMTACGVQSQSAGVGRQSSRGAASARDMRTSVYCYTGSREKVC